MAESKDEWWVSRGGQRFGPVDFETLVESARAGRLEPRTDLVMGGDFEDWVPAGEVDGVFERNEPDGPESEEVEGHEPPEDALADSGSFDFGDKETKLKLPGAPRLGYLLGITVLPAILVVGLGKVMPKLESVLGPEFERFAPLVVLIIPILVIVITVKRFQNIGMSGWWLLALLVPLLNLWLYYRLIACPPGYVYTRKLDVWGWILAVLYWLGFVAYVAFVFMFGITMVKEMYEGGQFQEIKNQWEEIKTAPPPSQ